LFMGLHATDILEKTGTTRAFGIAGKSLNST
jgi:hypothetical protein